MATIALKEGAAAAAQMRRAILQIVRMCISLRRVEVQTIQLLEENLTSGSASTQSWNAVPTASATARLPVARPTCRGGSCAPRGPTPVGGSSVFVITAFQHGI